MDQELVQCEDEVGTLKFFNKRVVCTLCQLQCFF